MNRFRPQSIPKAVIMKQRLHYGRADNYNWQTRVRWFPAAMTRNKIGILRRWQQIHHYAGHTDRPARHWLTANRMFNEKFLAHRGRASVRFLNTRTAHSWL